MSVNGEIGEIVPIKVDWWYEVGVATDVAGRGVVGGHINWRLGEWGGLSV